MRNILIEMSYDGTNYHGFQTQKNANTIQETIEKAFFRLTGEKTIIYGCGRTDAGVHAMKYFFNFKTNSRIPADKFPFAISPYLPDDIIFKNGYDVSEDFHARYNIKEKTYVYKILNDNRPDPFLRNYAYFYPQQLNLEAMKNAAEKIVGKKDFRCFMASGGQVKTTVRTVKSLEIKKNGKLLEIYVSADGFLYNMVRIITGTLIGVGIGKLTPNDIEKAIESKKREDLGITVPPTGLFMYDIKY